MQQPIIQLKKASVARAGRNLVSGVDWVVMPGEHWALLGSNGAGKSTLMRLARGDMPPTGGERTYCFDGRRQFTPIGVRRRMAMVSASLHDKYAGAGWRVSGREAVLAGFFDAWLLYDEPTETMREACEGTLASLGLLPLADKLVGEMSSGELRKVLVARALAPSPDLLFLDECMEGLDRSSRLSMLEVLERAGGAAESGAGLVVAAHRLDEIPGCVDRALLLSQGRVAACGGYGEVAAEYAGRPVASSTAAPTVAAEGKAYACAIAFQDHPFLFRLAQGAHTMRGTPILQGVDWTMRPGECWAITGDNGAGKSTLVKLLLGLVDPMPETVIRWFGGSALPDMTDVRRRVGLVSGELQTGYEYDLTAREVVWSGFFGSIGLYEEGTPAMRERAAEAMDFFGVTALAERPVSQLSTGQMRRVLLARAVAPGPALLFLDEPTAGLDQHSRTLTLSLLQRLAEAGMPLVLITHHDDELIPAISHVLHLEQGRVGAVAAV